MNNHWLSLILVLELHLLGSYTNHYYTKENHSIYIPVKCRVIGDCGLDRQTGDRERGDRHLVCGHAAVGPEVDLCDRVIVGGHGLGRGGAIIAGLARETHPASHEMRGARKIEATLVTLHKCQMLPSSFQVIIQQFLSIVC